MFTRKTALAVAAGAAALILVVVVLGVTLGGGGPSRHTATTGASLPHAPTPTSASAGNYHPTYNSVPADGSAPLPGAQVAALETLQPPPPAYVPSLPAVSTADRRDPIDFSVAFTRELLDLDFATTTQDEVAAWAQAEAAGLVIPGVPSNAGDNSLYASLFAPTVAGLGSWVRDPLPQPSVWASYAKQGEQWRVTGLFATEDPSWAQTIASGKRFPDPLMTVEDVTGTITTTIQGRHPSSRPFKLVVGLGSALHHPGYGAVSVVTGS